MATGVTGIHPPDGLDFSRTYREVWRDWIEKFNGQKRASQLSEKEKKVQVDNLLDLIGRRS